MSHTRSRPRLHMGCGESLHSRLSQRLPAAPAGEALPAPRRKTQPSAKARTRT
ncbi:hypothetical protein QVG61_10925 [Thiohalobacter sp. IOR34]|uniref:hypothetical protein n=1 Tax=Thiohalobacter sp. IOR34 TaxID=3057176 RepID=UPI0025B1A80D|nr:hypothetical protein [Thiohalobacter sp. IOR34]WJW75006.1 hypothetical protein QVG61_10925 [Thiohalobacter sp. IOR34]